MEGHADFVAEILKGDVKSAKIITTEGARLIEGILIGRHFSEAPIITSRICGICPVVHKLSSLKALENAFGLKPSKQTIVLRKIMNWAQLIHSHALHLFFLSLPDFFAIENDLNFIRKYPKETEEAIRVRQWALKIIEVIGGRAVHPIACEVGGFKTLPQENDLMNLLDGYESVLKDALGLAHLTLKIKFPRFQRPTTFVSLTHKDEYAYYSGDIKISRPDGSVKHIKSADYTKNIREIEEPYRAAKSASLDGEPFMVGAIARINNNHQQLNPLARGILKSLKWRWPQYNSFENITAQAIEIVHALEEINHLIKSLAGDYNEKEKSLSAGLNLIAGANPLGVAVKGLDAIEAPRGTLYHHYGLDASGYLTDCDIITPTVCYLKNIEEDVKAYIPDLEKINAKDKIIKIRSLIRAYDPCIACATH